MTTNNTQSVTNESTTDKAAPQWRTRLTGKHDKTGVFWPDGNELVYRNFFGMQEIGPMVRVGMGQQVARIMNAVNADTLSHAADLIEALTEPQS